MNLINKFFNKVFHCYKSINRKNKRVSFLDDFCSEDLDYICDVKQKKILIIGIFLTDYSNNVEHLVENFKQTNIHSIKQLWIAIGENKVPEFMLPYTYKHLKNKTPKFELLNKIFNELENLDYYDYIIISDDDIVIHKDFIDVYIDIVDKYKLRIAQPARAEHSYNVHKIVLENKSLLARTTNFVEIGPIFSFHKSVYSHVIPFPENSEMGWGLDYIWPKTAENNNFSIGIVDLVPVDHSYRPQSKTYSNDINKKLMQELLKSHENNFGNSMKSFQVFKK